MSDKKFAGIDGAVVSDAVSSDYETALCFEKLRVGALGAYFRDGFKTRFLSYDRVERVFLRIGGKRQALLRQHYLRILQTCIRC